MQLRILSLDGGGSWALIQIRALAAIYSQVFGKPASDVTGHEVLRRFDLIAANSGGTLALAGLIKNWPLEQIQRRFEDEIWRRKIFAPADVFQRPLEHVPRVAGIGPKYSTEKKLMGLRDFLSEQSAMQLTSLPAMIGKNYAGRLPHFLFCALNYDTERAAFMRSDASSRAASGAEPASLTLLDAVHASANPPVNLFDLPALRSDGVRCWDGAIAGHNNPVMAAVIEALANREAYDTSRGEIKALSLGTGNTRLPVKNGDLMPDDAPYYVKAERPWIFADVKKLALAIMGDPPDAATFHAHMLLDGPLPTRDGAPTDSPIVRMNPMIQPVEDGEGGWTAPPGYDEESFAALRRLDMDGLSESDIAIIEKFCDGWMKDEVPNQPVRTNSKNFHPEIGFARYSEALAAAISRFA